MPTSFTSFLYLFGGNRPCANETDRSLVGGRISSTGTAIKDLLEQGWYRPLPLSVD